MVAIRLAVYVQNSLIDKIVLQIRATNCYLFDDTKQLYLKSEYYI